jgi:uncharacterized protein YndB with AHSA1/START domain
MEDKTQIIAEEGKQELFIIREFDAPRDMVFDAFSNTEILVQFFAPFDNTMHFNHHDYKTGGSYSWCNKNKEGKTLCTFYGVIHELTAPERIIHTSEFMELPERGNVVLEVIKFEELPDNKTKMIIHEVCPSVATRNAMIESGMEMGLVDIFNKLDKLLGQLSKSN